MLGEPPAGSAEGGRVTAWVTRFIHSENHNSSLRSLRLTSSQETSTHQFLNRARLSWASPLSSSKACCSFVWSTKTSEIKRINAEVFRCDGTSSFFQTGLLGNLSKRGRNEGKISCNGMENEVRIYFWGSLNKHQKVFYKEQKLQMKIKTDDKTTRQKRRITNSLPRECVGL